MVDIVRCLFGIWICVYYISCMEENVALNKIASTTSGTLRNWQPSGAVDGDHVKLDSPSSCFHSAISPSDWTVDLGQEYQLYNITVYFRRTYERRLANSVIYVDNDPSRVCYTFPSSISNNPTRLTCNETARYVTIRNPGDDGYEDSLNICEVEVYACTGGYRDVDCNADCHCDECDRWTGICNSTCTPGWEEQRCDRACNGAYGSSCNNSCAARQCSNSPSSCDPVNGTCDSGCLAGWTGHDCTTECQSSNYGLNCLKNCTNRQCIMDNSTCDHVTGSCDLGCIPGWKSLDCRKECVEGEEFGANCASSCNARNCLNQSSCDPTTGLCDFGCETGWEGSQCLKAVPITEATTDTEGDPSPGTGVGVIAGAAAAGVLVVLVLVLLTVLLIRRKNRKSMDRPSHSESFNQIHGTKDRTQQANVYENFALQEEKTKDSKESKKGTSDHKVQVVNIASAQAVRTHDKEGKSLQKLEINGKGKYDNEEEEEEEEEEEDNENEPVTENCIAQMADSDEKNYYNLNQVDSKHALSLSKLPQRLKEMMENPSAVKVEYETLPQDFLYSYEESQEKENKGKNRFRGYYPYDYNRVVLRDSEDETDGDYINASYIDGYKADKRFIAAQGPYKTELFEDFWRMIWQEGCTAIVMVTSLVEDGKMKCLRYWPEKGTENYGRFTVTTETRIQLADYTITNLVVQNSQHSKKRHIKHFYFTSWSDHGVPDISGLLTFMRRVQNFTKGQQQPIVVHCSAGIGRTGTYIAVESLVNQATTEGVVDVVSFVTNMRGQRRNMVQTQAQYHFIYKAVSHAVTYGDTSLSVDVIKHLDLDQIAHFTMGNTTVEKHLQILQESHSGEERPGGLNSLPSYRSSHGFILKTSQPDGDEIWNLVFKGDVRIVITDDICEELFSSDSGVTFTKRREISLSEDVTMCSVTLTNQDGERTVQIQYYQVRGDLNEGTVSVLTDSLLQGTGQAEGQATAVVSRSVRDCVLLVLLSNVVSRLQVEEKVDIINDMTRLQQHLPHMIFNMGNVRRCLAFCKRWIESSETYANL